MSKQSINVGSSVNDGTGTQLRTAGQYINNNFNEIYSSLGNGTDLNIGNLTQSINFLQTTGATSISVSEKLKDSVSVKDFGAPGGATVDNTSYFQAALDYLYNTHKGGTLILSPGVQYGINGVLNVWPNCTIKGTISSPGQLWQNLNGKRFNYKSNPGLILATTGQIVLWTTSTIKDCSIISKAVWDWGSPVDHSSAEVNSFVTSFNSYLPAITTPASGSADCLVQNCAIAGFSYAVRTPSTSNNRFTVRDVLIDCTNGIDIEQTGDLGKLENCHAWPFTTTNADYTDGVSSPSITSALQRTGTAFRFGNAGVGVDWGKMTNCFSYGYAIGFHLDGTRTAILTGCGSDNRLGNTNSIGFKLSPQYEATLIGCQAAANDYGFYVDTTGVAGTYPNEYFVKFIGCSVWDTPQAGMFVKRGIVSVEGCSFRINGGPNSSINTYPIGISFDYDAFINSSTFNRSVINGCVFRGSANIPAIRHRTTSGGAWVSGAFTNLTVGYNTYLNNTPRISPQF